MAKPPSCKIFHWRASAPARTTLNVDTTLLIEALVRQTMVLIATLATSTGSRTPLARIADQVFADLVAELKTRGLGSKLIADMFGMAMRTYHYRMARLAESATERGRSVWEAVLDHVRSHGTVLRTDVLRRFDRDDAEVVRSVLRDLVDSRLLFRAGRGDSTAYRAASDEPAEAAADSGAREQLLLVALHRFGPLGRDELARHVSLPDATLSALLQQLVREGRVLQSDTAGIPIYRHESLLIDYGDAQGWQAALFDHYQAVVSAMCAKLRSGRAQTHAADQVGGSTYHFDLWPGHPNEREVLNLLADVRARMRALCERVQAVNEELAPDTQLSPRRVVAYVGQHVVQDEEGIDDDAFS